MNEERAKLFEEAAQTAPEQEECDFWECDFWDYLAAATVIAAVGFIGYYLCQSDYVAAAIVAAVGFIGYCLYYFSEECEDSPE